MNKYDEVLELETPHGYLISQGKETAIARVEPLNTGAAYLIASGGEAFGVATLEQPAQIRAKEFDNDEWFDQHRITVRERRQWWPENEIFYIYRLKDWTPFEGVKLYQDGQVTDEPRLNGKQREVVTLAKGLPKQVTLLDDALIATEDKEFGLDQKVWGLCDIGHLTKVLKATFDLNAVMLKAGGNMGDHIPIYSLALVRNPRMRLSKKNLSPEGAKAEIEIEISPEGEDTMPYKIRERDGEYCVMKINPDETESVEKCHPSMEMAREHLAALNINVTAEEEDAYDKPKPKKPKKDFDADPPLPVDEETKGIISQVVNSDTPPSKDDTTFFKRLKLAAKNLLDIVTLAERDQKDDIKLFVDKVGVTQKEVNGELWHFTWSTNAFEDREREIFSTESLRKYVDQANQKDDKGYFNLWHIQGTDFARKEWQMVIGRFLVEAGPYLNDKAGQAAREFFKRHSDGHPEIAPEGWGCSPEFRYLPEERATGIYENIWITRTSTLPRMAAANIWTETAQLTRSKMAISDYSEDQIKAAIEVFKDEDFVRSLIQKGETKTAELEAAGVAHKGQTEQHEAAQKPPEIQLNMTELAAEVGKQFTANLSPVMEAIEMQAASIKAIAERLAKLEKDKEVKGLTDTPRFVFNMQRASEAKETVVTEADKLFNSKPSETVGNNDDAWGQMKFNVKR